MAAHPHTAPETLELLVAGSAARDVDAAVRDELRIQVAKNPSAPVAVLRRLVEDRAPEVRRAASGHPATPPEVLRDLWRLGASRDLSRYQAPDPGLAPGELAALAARGTWSRQLIARHRFAPSSLLFALRDDEEPLVRQALAQHPQASPELLELLASDLDRDTRWYVAKHPATPPPVVERLAQEERIRWELAAFAQTPPALLVQLAQDPDGFVRQRLAWNPASPAWLLERLQRDPSPAVQEAARAAARRRGLG